MLTFKKCDTNPIVYQHLFLDIVSKYSNFQISFTDCSKSDSGVGCAFKIGLLERYFKLSFASSIFTAELMALIQILTKIKFLNGSKFLICSDSMCVLKSLENIFTQHPLVQKILILVKKLQDLNMEIIFFWIPSHKNILGNEIVDSLAKKGCFKTKFRLHSYELFRPKKLYKRMYF